MVFSSGSIRELVYSGISPFPDSVSGVLVSLVNNAIFRVENETGETLGTSINDKFQPSVTNFATSNVLRLMAVQDLGVNRIRVGDLGTSNENLKEMSRQFEEMANIDLKSIKSKAKVFKARG